MMSVGYSDMRRDREFHTLGVPEVFQLLESGPGGLTSSEAGKRLRQHGRNVIREAPRKPLYLKFIANFTHLMAILLWAAGAMAFAGGMPQLGWAVWCVVVINAIFTFWQEYQAERAVEALRRLLPEQATVLRDGEERVVPAEELVPGDVVVISEGDKISADGRIVDETELRIDQSTLSGESHPARKTADPMRQLSLSRTEFPNLVFAGTMAAAGTGKAVIFATGMSTEFGRIAHLTSATAEAPSPLQQEIDRMTRIVTMLAVGIGAVFFLLSVTFMQRPAGAGFIFAIGMVVAFVPEGLLPTVTLSLAMAVKRMARRNALVKRLSSVEALGCCTVICTDKTGTLTQNEMTVRELWVAGRALSATGVGYAPEGEIVEAGKAVQAAADPDLRRLLLAAGLCNDSRLIPPDERGGRWTVIGDPTEAALKVAAAKGGVDLDAESALLPRLRELPFDSVRKRMSTVHRELDGETVFVKGAPREIVALCGGVMKSGAAAVLTAELKGEVLAATDALARDGLRVLAVAQRRLGTGFREYLPRMVERELVLLGLVAMLDPARPEVASAVDICGRAGIRVIMMTGDYGLTAESIARRIGIVTGEGARVVSGAELDAMDDAALESALAGQVLFARVAPEHKLRVVTALQKLEQVVAVTGDGVNDAPALRKADIGVAMGMAGTDVAKEAADIILIDDNFASIVNAVEEGRAVYANIKKFTTYIFSDNVTEAWPFIVQIMFNVPLALTVMQVLAIDLGTDLVPALALGTERPEPGGMDKPPRSRKERLVNGRLLVRALLWLGTLQTLLCFSAFFLVYRSYGYTDLLGLPRPDLVPYAQRLSTFDGRVYITATSLFLAAVVCAQIGNAYACRTERLSVFSVGLCSNRFLLLGIAVELAVCSLLLYLPALQPVFEVGALPLRFWGVLLAFPILMLLPEEGRKAWLRRRAKRDRARQSIAGGAS